MNIDTQSTFEARGYTWMRHTPGDPCPVPPDTLVHILMRCQEEGAQEAAKAKLYDWGIEDLQVEGQIIGWRYAETPQPSAPDTNEQEKRLESILATIREVHATLKTTLGYAEQDSIAIHSSVEKLEKYL